MSFSDRKSEEIDRNLVRFLEQLSAVAAEHEGEYALMRHGEIVDFYSSAIDAQIAGNCRFGDAIFSIQHVKEAAEELGCFSYAIDNRPT